MKKRTGMLALTDTVNDKFASSMKCSNRSHLSSSWTILFQCGRVAHIFDAVTYVLNLLSALFEGILDIEHKTNGNVSE
jgi:hypothetical protein